MITDHLRCPLHVGKEIRNAHLLAKSIFIILVDYLFGFFPLAEEEFPVSGNIGFFFTFKFSFPAMIYTGYFITVFRQVLAFFRTAKIPSVYIIYVSILIIIDTVAVYFPGISP